MPAKVDELFEEISKKNPEYSDAQAWATAWSVYCKYVNPGSDHCHLPPSEYLKRCAMYKPSKEVERLTLVAALSKTGVSRTVSKDIADAILRKRDLAALAVQKKWPVDPDSLVLTGPQGRLNLNMLK